MNRNNIVTIMLLASMLLVGCNNGDESGDVTTSESAVEETTDVSEEESTSTTENEDITLADLNLSMSEDGKLSILEPITIEVSDIRFDLEYTDQEKEDIAPFFEERINYAAEMVLTFYNGDMTMDEFIWEEDTPQSIEKLYEQMSNVTAEAMELNYFPDFNNIEEAVYFDIPDEERIGARSVFTIVNESGEAVGRYNLNIGEDMELLYLNYNTY